MDGTDAPRFGIVPAHAAEPEAEDPLILLDIAGWAMLAVSVLLAGTGVLRPDTEQPGAAAYLGAACLLAAALAVAGVLHKRRTRPGLSSSAAVTSLVIVAVQLTGGASGPLFPAYFLMLLWMGLPRIEGPVLEAGILVGLCEAASEVFYGGGGLGSLLERAAPTLRALLGIPLFAAACEVLLERTGQATAAPEPAQDVDPKAGDDFSLLISRCASASSVAAAMHAAAEWLVDHGGDLTATVALLEDDAGTLKVYESLGPLSQGRSGRSLQASDSIAGWVSRSGGTVRRNRLRMGERPAFTLSASDEQGGGAGSCVASQLVCSGRSAGVLLLESTSDEGFGQGAESPVSLAATVLGLSLEKLLLEEQRRMVHGRDGLTGLPVLSDAMEFLLRATRDVQRFGKSVSVLVTGIDSLPGINAVEGYRYGDSVLAACASRLRDLAGEGAMVARVGGDRFAICLVGADRGKAEAVGDCVLRSFADHPVAADGREQIVAVSVGASTTKADRRVPQLLTEACRALCSAREAGGRALRAVELSAVPKQAGGQ